MTVREFLADSMQKFFLKHRAGVPTDSAEYGIVISSYEQLIEKYEKKILNKEKFLKEQDQVIKDLEKAEKKELSDKNLESLIDEDLRRLEQILRDTEANIERYSKELDAKQPGAVASLDEYAEKLAAALEKDMGKMPKIDLLKKYGIKTIFHHTTGNKARLNRRLLKRPIALTERTTTELPSDVIKMYYRIVKAREKVEELKARIHYIKTYRKQYKEAKHDEIEREYQIKKTRETRRKKGANSKLARLRKNLEETKRDYATFKTQYETAFVPQPELSNEEEQKTKVM